MESPNRRSLIESLNEKLKACVPEYRTTFTRLPKIYYKKNLYLFLGLVFNFHITDENLLLILH